MSQIEARVGLTPILKRLAYYYMVGKGLGRHKIVDELYGYDAVDIVELYPWGPNPQNEEEYGAAVKVTFLRDGDAIRWVEFSVRFVGGGGEAVIRAVP
jgi:hypothetical protein